MWIHQNASNRINTITTQSEYLQFQTKKDTGIMTWITMTTSIWLMKGFVRKSMKLQNIIETGIFTVHCLRRLLWIDNRFLKTRFQFKTSDETAKMYDYVICIIMKNMMRCWVEEQTSLLIAWAIQIFQILLSIIFCDVNVSIGISVFPIGISG